MDSSSWMTTRTSSMLSSPTPPTQRDQLRAYSRSHTSSCSSVLSRKEVSLPLKVVRSPSSAEPSGSFTFEFISVLHLAWGLQFHMPQFLFYGLQVCSRQFACFWLSNLRSSICFQASIVYSTPIKKDAELNKINMAITKVFALYLSANAPA